VWDVGVTLSETTALGRNFAAENAPLRSRLGLEPRLQAVPGFDDGCGMWE